MFSVKEFIQENLWGYSIFTEEVQLISYDNMIKMYLSILRIFML